MYVIDLKEDLYVRKQVGVCVRHARGGVGGLAMNIFR